MKLNKKLSLLLLLVTTTALLAQERDVSKWIEIPCPKDPQSAEGALWFYRANYSTNEWRVFRDNQAVCAMLKTKTNLVTGEVPKFTPETGKFRRVAASLKVADGWLVGFNHGEWGGALYWFSPDGTEKYEISKGNIVDFIQASNRIFAISGLAHLGLSEGSILSISQSSNQTPWQITNRWRLPQAPEVVIQHPDGDLLIALSDSFVSVTLDGKIKTIVKEGRWGSLYPFSMVLSGDARTAYVGMRQFVAKVTLKNGRVSFLVPDRSYLNQLPKEEEDRIRKIYGK